MLEITTVMVDITLMNTLCLGQHFMYMVSIVKIRINTGINMWLYLWAEW